MPTDHDRLRQYTEFLLDELRDEYGSFAAWTEPSIDGTNDDSRATLYMKWLEDKYYTLNRSMLLFKHLVKTGIVEPQSDEGFGTELLKFLSNPDLALSAKELRSQESWSGAMIKSGTMTPAQLTQHLQTLHETVGGPEQYRVAALNSLNGSYVAATMFLQIVNDELDGVKGKTAPLLSTLLLSDHITRLRQPLQTLQSTLKAADEGNERIAMQRLLAEE